MTFLNTPNSQIVIFSDRTPWAEHKSVWIFKIGSVVQKIQSFLCLKIGPEVEKCLTETKKEMWQIRWHHKDTKKGVFLVLSWNVQELSKWNLATYWKKECWIYLQCQKRVSYYCSEHPKGRPGMSDVSPLSGISGLSFDSTLLSPLLFFCLVLLPFLSFSASWPFLLNFFQKILQYFLFRDSFFVVVWLLFSSKEK